MAADQQETTMANESEVSRDPTGDAYYAALLRLNDFLNDMEGRISRLVVIDHALGVGSTPGSPVYGYEHVDGDEDEVPPRRKRRAA
jgi:hypothetical protein